MKTDLEALKELKQIWHPKNLFRGLNHFDQLCDRHRVPVEGLYHCRTDECPLAMKWGGGCNTAGTKYNQWSKTVMVRQVPLGFVELVETDESKEIADSIYVDIVELIAKEEARPK